MTAIERLRAALTVDPCPTHKDQCPIPSKRPKKPCSWGHTAMEFAEDCKFCANIVLATMEPKQLNYAQRLHHRHREQKHHRGAVERENLVVSGWSKEGVLGRR